MLTEVQKNNIIRNAKFYVDQGNIRGAIGSVIGDMKACKVCVNQRDYLILNEAKDWPSMLKVLQGYHWWPK